MSSIKRTTKQMLELQHLEVNRLQEEKDTLNRRVEELEFKIDSLCDLLHIAESVFDMMRSSPDAEDIYFRFRSLQRGEVT